MSLLARHAPDEAVGLLLGLMRDPPCDICKARRAVHQTSELFSQHTFLMPTLSGLADWYEEVTQHLSNLAATPAAGPEPAPPEIDVERLRVAFWTTQEEIKRIYREELAVKEARGGNHFLYDHETDTRLLDRYADAIAAAYQAAGEGEADGPVAAERRHPHGHPDPAAHEAELARLRKERT